MQCNQCGGEIDIVNWKCCPRCGSGFTDEKVISATERFFTTRRNIYILIVFVVAVIAFFDWQLYRSGKEIERKNAELEVYASREGAVTVEWTPVEKVMPLIAGEKNILGRLRIASQQLTQLRVEIVAEGITEKKSEVVSVRPATVELEFGAPFSREGYQRLKEGSQKSDLVVRVFQLGKDGERLILEKKDSLFFNSIYEIIWKTEVENHSAKALRLVDKDDPEVIALLHKASGYVEEFGGTKNAFLGGLNYDPKEVRAEVQAIFKAMQRDYELRYIVSAFSYNGGGIQQLKDPSQVLRTRSGICIDLSLLMVAALENIGLDPALVFLESHVFPGVELGYKSENFIFIESTALNRTPQEAVRIGQESWKELRRKDNPETYDLVRVTEARSEGILPVLGGIKN